MYSMVLMMAVSTSPDAAALGNGIGFFGHSCNGSSCHGSSCHGSSCHGSGIFGLNLFSKHHGCTGCTGCVGCIGTPIQSTIGVPVSSAPFISSPVVGTPVLNNPSYPHETTTIPTTNYTPIIPAVSNPTELPKVLPNTGNTEIPVGPKMTEPKIEEPKGKVSMVEDNSKAFITVQLPADARLKVEGEVIASSASKVRIFATPTLKPGTVYYYDVVAEVTRDGKTLTASEKVAVDAGSKVTVKLDPKN